jgi:hypothetical protein
MRALLCLGAALLIIGQIGSVPLLAQERSAVRQGFALTPQSGKTILLLRPAIKVSEQSTGGIPEPRAEWTDSARTHIDAALIALQRQLGNAVITAPEAYGEDARRVSEHMALFGAVSRAVIT